MQKIVPCLWFDSQSEEVANYYTSLFNGSIIETQQYLKASEEVSGKPEGSVLTVEFEIAGLRIVALNGGSNFTLNPSISLSVQTETEVEADRLWESLSDGATVLMPYQKYPFSKKYGWLNDKHGVSWQISVTGTPLHIAPSLLFVQEQFGKVEAAINLYTAIFKNSATNMIARYEEGDGDKAGYIKFSEFLLEGQTFYAMESSLDHQFMFNEAFSFMIMCENQQDIDYYWEKLTDGGEESVCGWLKDRFGVSWQVAPIRLNELIGSPNKEIAERAMEAMLTMKKIDMNEIENAVSRL